MWCMHTPIVGQAYRVRKGKSKCVVRKKVWKVRFYLVFRPFLFLGMKTSSAPSSPKFSVEKLQGDPERVTLDFPIVRPENRIRGVTIRTTLPVPWKIRLCRRRYRDSRFWRIPYRLPASALAGREYQRDWRCCLQ